jgi:hypothetical protein
MKAATGAASIIKPYLTELENVHSITCYEAITTLTNISIAFVQ